MQLQAALDYNYKAPDARSETSLSELTVFDAALAKKLLSEAGDSVDIVEIGTPFVLEYGLAAVRELKAAFPEKTILADLKIADAGYHEAASAFLHGADIVTVLGVTEDATITGAIAAARAYGRAVMVDMLAVADLPARLAQVDKMGADYICLHTSKDLQRLNPDAAKSFALLKNYVNYAKLVLAGGINRTTVEKFASIQPDVIIVGEGITGADSYAEATAFFKSALRSAERSVTA
mgnify:CR=1 FL=1